MRLSLLCLAMGEAWHEVKTTRRRLMNTTRVQTCNASKDEPVDESIFEEVDVTHNFKCVVLLDEQCKQFFCGVNTTSFHTFPALVFRDYHVGRPDRFCVDRKCQPTVQ